VLLTLIVFGVNKQIENTNTNYSSDK